MAGFSAIVKVIEEPKLESVGKGTPKVTLKVSEDVRKKVDGKWKTTGQNFYEIDFWRDNALEAVTLSTGDLVDLRAYVDDDRIRFRVAVNEDTWEWKGKQYSKLKLVGFEFEKMEKNDD